VSGVNELRRALLKDKEIFVSTVTEKLMIYALGRGLTANDMPSVRSIVKASAAGGYRFASLVDGIVMSPSFRMRRAMAPEGQQVRGPDTPVASAR